MSTLPNPFDSVATPHAVTEEAAVSSPRISLRDAAASPITASESEVEELPPADALNPHETGGTFDLDAEDCIHEIFYYYASKLARDRRFDRYFDELKFMEAIEEPPLFLRAVG